MYIGVYGWARPDGGSHESSSFLILEELAARGHHIVRFAPIDDPAIGSNTLTKGHVVVPAGLPSRSSRLERFLGPTSSAKSHLYDRVFRVSRHWNNVSRQMRHWHEHVSPFDVTLNLGTDAQVHIPHVPHVAWPQAPPGTEAVAFLAFANEHRKWMRLSRWLLLYAYNTLRVRVQNARLQPHASVVISQSPWGVQRWSSYHHDVRLVPYAIVVPCEDSADTPAPHDPPRFLHVGRMDPRKQIVLLVQAFAEVRARCPKAELHLVGGLGYAPEIYNVFRTSPGITYHGIVKRDDVVGHLSRCDVLVQTSNGETLGTAVAEGLTAGCTVVVGSDNGTAHYLDATSQVFEEYRPRAVAEAMMEALDLRRSAPVLAGNLARAAAAPFCPRQVADDFLALLDDVISASSRRP